MAMKFNLNEFAREACRIGNNLDRAYCNAEELEWYYGDGFCNTEDEEYEYEEFGRQISRLDPNDGSGRRTEWYYGCTPRETKEILLRDFPWLARI